MPAQVSLSPSVSTPHFNQTKSLPLLSNSNSVRASSPAHSLKEVEIIHIHATTATFPWTYSPDQYCLKINNTIYFLSMNIDPQGNLISISWVFTRFDQKCYQYSVIDTVGRTKFDVGALENLGKSTIESFGTSHAVFWNTQNFLNEYLRSITQGDFKPINTAPSDLRISAFAKTLVRPQIHVHVPHIHRELGFEPKPKGIVRPGLGLRRETQ